MPMNDSGRSYARIYDYVRRSEHHEFVQQAVERAGGRVLAASPPNQAPLFLGIEDDRGERLALCAYVFLANRRDIRNRPQDEHRLQIRYGDVNDASWRTQSHPVGFDPLSVDITLVLGAHLDRDLLIGLDPLTYNPLPLGISIFFKDAEIDEAVQEGWHVWERDNISGIRRANTRTELGVETVIAFAPERLLDYLRLERTAQSLHLDPPLRFRAAEDAGAAQHAPEGVHALEREFSLTRDEILDIIRERPRLGMAVRGGVAERHLDKQFQADGNVVMIELGLQEGPPDFFVTLDSGEKVTVECKNASPVTYADGTPKVETQKTRASKGDPKSRLYEPAQFDVVAACMYGPSRRWEFRYKRSDRLERDKTYPDRIAAIQRVDSTWSTTLIDAVRV
jgi:hypothetical protein